MYEVNGDPSLQQSGRKKWLKRAVIGGVAVVLLGIGGVVAFEETPPCGCINPELLTPTTVTPVQPTNPPEARIHGLTLNGLETISVL